MRLDDREDREFAEADPNLAVESGDKPLLVDEWQLVPDVLASIKRVVDSDPVSNQFIVTGSARNDFLADLWPATGRLMNISMWPLVGRERFGDAHAPTLFDRWDSPRRWFKTPTAPPGIRDYIDIALESGFPAALTAPDDSARRRWLRTYINNTVSRDVEPVDRSSQRRKNPQGLKYFLNAYAVHSAGVVSDQAIYETANLARKTFISYHDIFQAIGLIQDVNAWRSNLLRRLTATPKRYMTDSGLAAALMKVNTSTVLRNASLRGGLLDTFIAAQLRVEAEASEKEVNLFHLRTERGEHEIDLLAEVNGSLVAFEFKAGDSPSASDAKHLKWLKSQVGQNLFLGGVVFHTGRRRYKLDDGIEAVPIACLWG